MQVGMYVVLGLVWTIGPLALIIAAQSPTLQRVGRLPGRGRQVALAFVAVVAMIVSLTGVARSYSVFRLLRDSYLHGRFATITGPIENFRDETYHPVIPGRFTICGHTFAWDPGSYVQRFSASIDVHHTGPFSHSPQFANPLHNGMTVRLRFTDDRIFRLEALASELPSELAASIPTCDAAR
jgi:hypothetical protein